MGKKQPLEFSHLLLETIYQQKSNLLKSVLADFRSLNLKPQIGIELEFYLDKPELANQFISQLKSATNKEKINILDIEPEQGFGQIEVKTAPYLDLELLCEDIIKIKIIASSLAKNLNCQINFSSQPNLQDCGSALQINFSLIDQENNFLFSKNNQSESPYLLKSIEALLKLTNNAMLIFAPKPQDYSRFCLELNRSLHKNKKYTAPVNISWGYENRTTLIRIPTSKNVSQRRLEFRPISSDADIHLAITFFLLIILDGLNSEIEPISKPIYGNAFDEKYHLESLANNYQIANNRFFSDNKILEKIIQKFSKILDLPVSN